MNAQVSDDRQKTEEVAAVVEPSLVGTAGGPCTKILAFEGSARIYSWRPHFSKLQHQRKADKEYPPAP